MLQAPQLHGLSSDLGVEEFLIKRSRSNSKLISGLESLQESVQLFAGMSDHQSEEMLLISFIPPARGTDAKLNSAWKKVAADGIWIISIGMLNDLSSISD